MEPKTFRLQNLGYVSTMLTMGVLYAILGFIFALFLLLFGSLISGLAGANGAEVGASGLIGGIFSLILLPIFYGIAGLIGGALLALFYNISAKVTGGIQFTLLEWEE